MSSKPTIRCSELDRLLLCNGSRTITPLVEQCSSQEASDGTLVHAHIARELIINHGAHQDSEWVIAPDNLPLSASWIVRFCIREATQETPKDWNMQVEASFAYEFEQFSLSGHIDCFAVNEDATEAIGWDWKTGYDPVDAADMNEQVSGYIILLKRAYPTLRKITFKIVQPRNDEDEGFQRVSEVTVEFSDSDSLINAFEKRINAALGNPLEVNSGRAQCRYCPAAIQCPAIQKEIDLMKATLTPEIIASIQRTPNDALLGDFAVSSATLTKPFDQAKELLHARLDETATVTAGCGTVISRKIEKGSYTVEDAPRFHQELKTLLPDEARRVKVYSFSMSKIKDEIAEVFNVPKTGKASVTAESLFDAKLRQFVKQGERKKLIFQ